MYNNKCEIDKKYLLPELKKFTIELLQEKNINLDELYG